MCKSICPVGACPSTFVPPAACDFENTDALVCLVRTISGEDLPLSARDAAGNSTIYWYTQDGAPLFIEDVDGVVTEASYNDRGQRLSVDDPNMGYWEFDYNHFDELIAQRDARYDDSDPLFPHYEVQFKYDALGRMTHRWGQQPGGTMGDRWFYDYNCHLGALCSEERRFGVHASTGEGGTTHFKRYYTYEPRTLQVSRADTSLLKDPVAPGEGYAGYAQRYWFDSYFGREKARMTAGEVGSYPTFDVHGLETELALFDHYPHQEQFLRRPEMQDAYGAITKALNGNNTESRLENDASTGQVTRICVKDPIQVGCLSGQDYQQLTYEYDVFGNLKEQMNLSVGLGAGSSEVFTYDKLMRLTAADRVVDGTNYSLEYAYADNGNFTSKSDFATSYSYDPGRPNAVSQVTLASGGGTLAFQYDANGNLEHWGNVDSDADVQYDLFNLPTFMGLGETSPTDGPRTWFDYGPDNQRYRQQHESQESTETRYIGDYEEVYVDGVKTRWRNAVRGLALVTEEGLHYLHRDRLGSVERFTTLPDASGNPTIRRATGYGPFGKPREDDWAPSLNAGLLGDELTPRGFTDHEHLDSQRLIHMNGRAYSFDLGRFLSVDPFIQFPMNSQSLNPYSYILNNPLAGVDPTGYKAAELDDDLEDLKPGTYTTGFKGQEVTFHADGEGNFIVEAGKSFDMAFADGAIALNGSFSTTQDKTGGAESSDRIRSHDERQMVPMEESSKYDGGGPEDPASGAWRTNANSPMDEVNEVGTWDFLNYTEEKVERVVRGPWTEQRYIRESATLGRTDLEILVKLASRAGWPLAAFDFLLSATYHEFSVQFESYEVWNVIKGSRGDIFRSASGERIFTYENFGPIESKVSGPHYRVIDADYSGPVPWYLGIDDQMIDQSCLEAGSVLGQC